MDSYSRAGSWVVDPGRGAGNVHHTVHTERADKLFKRLRGARLDGSYEDEIRKLHRIDLLIIDDLALHRLAATETNHFYELIVEGESDRQRQKPRIGKPTQIDCATPLSVASGFTEHHLEPKSGT
jgi:hypothetical protein